MAVVLAASVPALNANAQPSSPRTATAASVLPPSETFRVVADPRGLRVLLRHQAPPGPRAVHRAVPVLFIHGASFPSALAAAFRFDGTSWMDDLAARGYDVWALDFLGYGGADRYPEMREPPDAHPPLGRAPEAARQIAVAVDFILRRTHDRRVSLVAHSWGTIPAGRYAGEHPERVARLVQFGPVARRDGPPDTSATPAYWYVTQEAQRARFARYVPAGADPVFDPRHFAVWGPAYLASDSTSRARTPASVAVPNGPGADIAEAWSGRLPYEPARITAPVLIVRGEWDTVTRDADAHWLYDALTRAPLKRDVKVSRGTHVMHLEASRFQLYAEVAAFLAEGDVAPPPARGAHTGAPR